MKHISINEMLVCIYYGDEASNMCDACISVRFGRQLVCYI